MVDDPAKPFIFLMDMLMLGVGVGFDTKGGEDKKCRVYRPQGPHEIYVIPDTREGWVESLRRLLNSYMLPDQKPVLFKYDKIREAGLPLETFGGVSAGCEPLMKLHLEVRKILESYSRNMQVGTTRSCCLLDGECYATSSKSLMLN